MSDIFVRIGKGEVESHVVHETEDTMAILDIAPAARGHTIVFPKEGYQVLAQVPDAVRFSLFSTLRNVRHAIARADRTVSGVTSIINQGPVAGQRAPHVLIHTIPRQGDDALFSRPVLGNAPDPKTLELLEPVLSLDDPTLSISIPNDRCAEGEILVVDAAVDLFEELSDERLDRFAAVLNAITSTIFERLGAEGTSILIESGSSQSTLGAEARIIPRLSDDGLDLTWSGAEVGDLREVRERIVSAIASLTTPTQETDQRSAPESVPEPRKTPENYLLKQLRRIP